MRKGSLRALSLGVALAAAALCWAPAVNADLDSTNSYTEPAPTLLMPFDATANRESFQIVSRIGGGDDVIATHWSFWAADCRHLFDVFICLTERDTVVVDPKNLQGEIQSPNPPANNKIGPIADLSGNRGMVTVTAFFADTGDSGLACEVEDVELLADPASQLVGGWTIANVTTSSAFGSDAVGVPFDVPGDPANLEFGIFIQSFNPQSLEDSEVIVLGAEFSSDDPGSGQGRFEGNEIGPIVEGNPKVCCDVSYIDNLEVEVSLPDFCFQCVGFAPVSQNVAEEGETPLIPPTVTVERPGFIHLTNCTVEDPDRTSTDIILISESADQFLYAWHGQAVGPFGTVVKGKYTGVGSFD